MTIIILKIISLPAESDGVHPESLGSTPDPVRGQVVALVGCHPVVGGEACVQSIPGSGKDWGDLEGIHLSQLGALGHWVGHRASHGRGGRHLKVEKVGR